MRISAIAAAATSNTRYPSWRAPGTAAPPRNCATQAVPNSTSDWRRWRRCSCCRCSGLALGVPPKRSNSGFGVFFSIVMLVTYHKVNEYAASIGELGRIDPAIALWVPFCVFAGLVIWMYYTIAYVPGGQPIGAIERGFSKIASAVTSRLPARRRKAREASRGRVS